VPIASNILVTVRRRSAKQRLWRELWALIRWGLGKSVYENHNSPFDTGVLGHEGFSVLGRKNAVEVEIVFYEDRNWPASDLPAIRKQMRDAVEKIAREHGYRGVYHRHRKPSPFV